MATGGFEQVPKWWFQCCMCRLFFLWAPGLPLLCFLTWLPQTLWGGAEAPGGEIAPPPSTLAKEKRAREREAESERIQKTR